MNTDTTQDKKIQRSGIEKELRLAGQTLDSLWMQARSATGRSRVEIHKQIKQLREKLQIDRKEQESQKKIESETNQTQESEAIQTKTDSPEK